MAILFSKRMFSGYAQVNETLRSDAWTWEELASADRLMLEARVSNQTGTPSLQVQLEHSNDGVTFEAKEGTDLLPATSVSGSARVVKFGQDDGGKVTGRYARLAVTITGASSAAHVELFVCGRSEL